jgi:hypothetical protein
LASNVRVEERSRRCVMVVAVGSIDRRMEGADLRFLTRTKLAPPSPDRP